MKLGVAGRIPVLDVDLCNTVNVTLTYSDILYVFQFGDADGMAVAQEWLESL